jgi:WD40 repeat protein
MPMVHRDAVVAVAYSPDGRTVLTGSEDKTAQLWSAKDGLPLALPVKHVEAVRGVYFSPDGKTILTTVLTSLPFGSSGPAVIGTGTDTDSAVTEAAVVWSLPDTVSTHAVLGRSLGPRGGVTALECDAKGGFVMTGNRDNSIQRWDARDGTAAGRPIDWPGFGPVRLRPDGQVVATVDQEGTLRLWNAALGTMVGREMKHKGDVAQFEFSSDNKVLVSASREGTAYLWNAADGSPIGRPMRLPTAITTVAFSSDGTTLVTGCADGTVQCWYTLSATPMGARLNVGSMVVLVAALGRDGKTLLTSCADGTTTFWNADLGQPIGQPAGTPIDPARPPLPSLQVPVYEVPVYGAPSLVFGEGSARPIVVDPAGRIAVIGNGQSAQCWDCAIGQPIGSPMRHRAPVITAGLSRDGTTVLTASLDGEARLWNAADGAPIGRPMRHSRDVMSVAFSPDGKTVLTGSADETARLWSAASGAPIGFPMKHDGPVYRAEFLGDGNTIVIFGTGSACVWPYPKEVPGDPATIRLWVECATGMELTELGDVRPLDEATLTARREQLRARGGQSFP